MKWYDRHWFAITFIAILWVLIMYFGLLQVTLRQAMTWGYSLKPQNSPYEPPPLFDRTAS